jgi:hypothetical protein
MGSEVGVRVGLLGLGLVQGLFSRAHGDRKRYEVIRYEVGKVKGWGKSPLLGFKVRSLSSIFVACFEMQPRGPRLPPDPFCAEAV